MEILKCEIALLTPEKKEYWFNFIHHVEVESTWKEFTDRATIMLPAALKIDKAELNAAIPAGSKVEIKLGYEAYGLTSVFKGYVVRVRNKIPIEIECEDEMYQLKRISINENCEDEKIGDYLARVFKPLKINVEAYDFTIHSMVVTNLTGVQLLDKIKSEYGFDSFFRPTKDGVVLVVGKPYGDNTNAKHTIIIDQSYDCNVKSQSLEYMNKTDVKLKITAISNMEDGTKETFSFGYEDGEERTLNFYNISKEKLQSLAESEAKKWIYTGWRGDLTLFGAPIVFHGDILTLKNRQGTDKTGDYYIDRVVYSFGVNGFEQCVEPGPTASKNE
jgi:hypothetical protein